MNWLRLSRSTESCRVADGITNQLGEIMNANPSGLLDAIKAKLQLKNDAALSRALETSPGAVCKMRKGILPIGATLLLRMIEDDIMTLPEIRQFVPRVVV